jgi:tetratricopeptide (TPR) repeat protein
MPLRKLFSFLLLAAMAVQAQVVPNPLSPVREQIYAKNWEKATRELDKAEQKGLCKEAVCLLVRTMIADGAGDGAQAVAYARRVAALFGPDSSLNAEQYNEAGAILYRRAQRDPELLKLAETAFRQADSLYKGDASNIRFNLATVLKAQGRTKEAKQIMDALEAAGLLINPGMAILGDFQRPSVQ